MILDRLRLSSRFKELQTLGGIVQPETVSGFKEIAHRDAAAVWRTLERNFFQREFLQLTLMELYLDLDSTGRKFFPQLYLSLTRTV